jgi:AraC-like DNA-binding protein
MLPSKDWVPGGYPLLRLLPDICYFAKDRQGRFIAANAGFLEIVECKTDSQLLGKTDYQIWPAFLAEQYVKDDARVLSTCEPMSNKIELVLRRDRSADWFSTTKSPLWGHNGEVIGIEGVSRLLKKGKMPIEQATKMPAVIDYIMENYARKIDVPTLAAIASMSLRQFERKFKREYGSVPVQYIQRIRLDAARQLLASTQLSIAQISRETGFYDSSHFSHQFQKSTGLAPKAFRQRHLAQASEGA